MDMSLVADKGLVLLGCGKMGSAMLLGWLSDGLPAASVWVTDPKPSDWLKSTGVQINAELPVDPAIVLVAVKPQMMGDALPAIAAMGNGPTMFVSVAAGNSRRGSCARNVVAGGCGGVSSRARYSENRKFSTRQHNEGVNSVHGDFSVTTVTV